MSDDIRCWACGRELEGKAANDALRRQNKLMRERLKANRDAPPA